MPMELDAVEARILGSLVEKSLTVPDQYPLSFNALLNACNQRSSREPVMSLDEPSLGKGLNSLLQKRLVERCGESGSRVPKFSHHIELVADADRPKAVGLLCVLLLRGPQTPGELKGRTERLCSFETTAEVEALLQELAAQPESPLVVRLPRQPGQKETRYQHTLCGKPPAVPEPAAAAPAVSSPLEARLTALEARMDALERKLSSNAR